MEPQTKSSHWRIGAEHSIWLISRLPHFWVGAELGHRRWRRWLIRLQNYWEFQKLKKNYQNFLNLEKLIFFQIFDSETFLKFRTFQNFIPQLIFKNHNKKNSNFQNYILKFLEFAIRKFLKSDSLECLIYSERTLKFYFLSLNFWNSFSRFFSEHFLKF